MTATAPFDLQLALHGHGWIYLAPHRFEEVTATWHLPLRAGAQVVDVQVRQRGTRLSIRLDAARKLSLAAIAKVRAQLAHMLRLHDDLSAFWRACEGHPTLAWTARRGAGRLLRSPTVFEDLMKLLFTTNCTWAATTAMTQKLVAALGSVSPSGARAFPTAARIHQNTLFFVAKLGFSLWTCIVYFTQWQVHEADFKCGRRVLVHIGVKIQAAVVLGSHVLH